MPAAEGGFRLKYEKDFLISKKNSPLAMIPPVQFCQPSKIWKSPQPDAGDQSAVNNANVKTEDVPDGVRTEEGNEEKLLLNVDGVTISYHHHN